MAFYTYMEQTAERLQELAKDGKAIAVMTIGSTEQHGPHLPVGTDSYLSQTYTRLVPDYVKSDATFLALPPIMFSLSMEHINYPGSIFLSARTFLSTLEDIGASLLRLGVKKLVVINAHGGNEHILPVAARQLRQLGMMTFIVNNMTIYDKMNLGIYCIHADNFETSMLMKLYPDLVRKDKITPDLDTSMAKWDTLADNYSDLIQVWFTEDMAVNGVIGDPNKATEEQGGEFLRQIMPLIGAALDEVAKKEW